MNHHGYYIGLMSGNSLDAIDAVLIDFTEKPCRLIAAHSDPFDHALKDQILRLSEDNTRVIHQFGAVHTQLGHAFAKTALKLLKKSTTSPNQVHGIGCAGQTIHHQPNYHHPFTLQAGDGNIIVSQTGITTVTDFRGKDIALGGQGAPFAPVFHDILFRSRHENRAVVNIGGISNISILPANINQPASGFDIGPGNILLNCWICKHKQQLMDKNGAWAASGKKDDALLTYLLKDDFFSKVPPKSSGREYFNLTWLDHCLSSCRRTLAPEDVQNTLAHLTAQIIANAVHDCKYPIKTVILCGGGTRNQYLLNLITSMLPSTNICLTNDFGIDVQWIEAALFAWLAKERLAHRAINLCTITGSQKPAVLGAVYSHD
jgi:anhydro-N-acetylmuramic acid kinase